MCPMVLPITTVLLFLNVINWTWNTPSNVHDMRSALPTTMIKCFPKHSENRMNHCIVNLVQSVSGHMSPFNRNSSENNMWPSLSLHLFRSLSLPLSLSLSSYVCLAICVHVQRACMRWIIILQPTYEIELTMIDHQIWAYVLIKSQ